MTKRHLPAPIFGCAALLLALLLWPGEAAFAQAPRTGSVIKVLSRAGLDGLLRSAKGGEIFTLVDGDYGRFDFHDLQFARPVVIQGSANALFSKEGRPKNLRNITFRGMTIAGNGGFNDGYAVIDPSNTDGVTFDGIVLANSDNTGFGLFLRPNSNNRNLRFINSEVTKLKYGLVLQNGENLVIQGNNFHHIRNDCIQLSGTRNVLITRNRFTEIYPSAGDHPDIVQMVNPNEDVTITYNYVNANSQGFAAYNEKPQTNVTISFNDISVPYVHAIRLTGAINGVIEGNRLGHYPGSRSDPQVSCEGKCKTRGNKSGGKPPF